MKLAIIGSRNFNDYNLVIAETLKLNPTEIISGGAKGADTLAEWFCREYLKKEPIVFLAKWDDLSAEPCCIKENRYGKLYNCLAGFNRNVDIVDACDIVLAFWDGKSKGTKHTIDLATQANKPVVIVNFGGSI